MNNLDNVEGYLKKQKGSTFKRIFGSFNVRYFVINFEQKILGYKVLKGDNAFLKAHRFNEINDFKITKQEKKEWEVCFTVKLVTKNYVLFCKDLKSLAVWESGFNIILKRDPGSYPHIKPDVFYSAYDLYVKDFKKKVSGDPKQSGIPGNERRSKSTIVSEISNVVYDGSGHKSSKFVSDFSLESSNKKSQTNDVANKKRGTIVFDSCDEENNELIDNAKKTNIQPRSSVETRQHNESILKENSSVNSPSKKKVTFDVKNTNLLIDNVDTVKSKEEDDFEICSFEPEDLIDPVNNIPHNLTQKFKTKQEQQADNIHNRHNLIEKDFNLKKPEVVKELQCNVKKQKGSDSETSNNSQRILEKIKSGDRKSQDIVYINQDDFNNSCVSEKSSKQPNYSCDNKIAKLSDSVIPTHKQSTNNKVIKTTVDDLKRKLNKTPPTSIYTKKGFTLQVISANAILDNQTTIIKCPNIKIEEFCITNPKLAKSTRPIFPSDLLDNW
jgi:hypothetical protein